MFNSEDVPTKPYPALAQAPKPHNTSRARIPLPGLPPVRTPIPQADDAFGVALEELTIEDAEPPTRLMSVSLPTSAEHAFELFCDSERIHEWMTIVRSSRVIARNQNGRPTRTSFIAQRERSSMGYTLYYDYDEQALRVNWMTGALSSMRLNGYAYFTNLKEGRCMMHYELDVDAATPAPQWKDPMYNGHPASAVLCDFRDYVTRICR